MKIKKVENNQADYPKSNEISNQEIKKKIPKKFIAIALIVILAQASYIVYDELFLTNEIAGGMMYIDSDMVNESIISYQGKKVNGTTIKSFLEKVEKLNEEYTFPVAITGTIEGEIISKETYIIELSDENGDSYFDTYHIKICK